MAMTRKTGDRLANVGSTLIIAALIVMAGFPVFWVMLNSLKLLPDIVTPVPKFFFEPTLENYLYVFSRRSVQEGLFNSLTIVGSAVAIGAALGIPAAYAVARFPNRLTNEVQFFVLSLRFLPPVAIAIPLIAIWLDLGLYDTRISLTVTYTLLTLSTIIWLAIPAFRRVPIEVEEAARVDGYGPYAVFFKVALPIAGNTLFGAIIFAFVLVWNEFMIALMLTTSEARTLPVIASEFTLLGRNVPWGILNASVVVLSLPPLIFVGVLSGFLGTVLNKDK